MFPTLNYLVMYRASLWMMSAWPLYWRDIYQHSIRQMGDKVFTVHNFTATTHGATYDFDFYEYARGGMVVGDTPDLNLAIILPKDMQGHLKSYMIGAIKNYFDAMGAASAIRHVGSINFPEKNTRHF